MPAVRKYNNEAMPSEEHIDDPGFGPDDFGPIDAAERDALSQDLVDVRTLKAVLASRGIRGVVVFCPDCDDDHYLGWDLLAGNLQQILENGTTPVHEPAWEPNPDEYVSWDYARGFLDGYESYPEDRNPGPAACLYCGSHLGEQPGDWAYCPYCGRDFAPINLLLHLRRLGWDNKKIAEVFDECGFVFPTFEAGEPSTFDLKKEPS
jgi:hypothetical protein